jgi:ATP-dependent helicase/nuclease subunit B
MVVVPTRQAGRRLREALARTCAEAGTALLSPQVVTPPYFLRPETPDPRIATPSLIKAVWTSVLIEADSSRYAALLGPAPDRKDFNWGLQTGEMIQRLRGTLADGGYLLRDVAERDDLEEPERWHNLAELEDSFLAHLKEQGLHDPCLRKIQDARQPVLPDGVKRLCVAAVPDPSLLMITALQRLEAHTSIEILIHAPEHMGNDFDTWGRPLSDTWAAYRIAIPNAQDNVILSETPAMQAAQTVRLIAGEAERHGPADIAIGVPDRAVILFLQDQFKAHGLKAFDPADREVKEHLVFYLLKTFTALATDGSFRAFASLLRHPDMLACLEAHAGVSSGPLLEQADTFQTRFLPARAQDIDARLDAAPHESFADLRAAYTFVAPFLERAHTTQAGQAIREFLQAVYRDREIGMESAEDQAFRAVSQRVDEALRELTAVLDSGTQLAGTSQLALFLLRLGEQQYHRDRTEADIDLEGWLELPWNDAPLLVVTGMNEGFVPDGKLHDVFLPDALRTQLGLRSDAQRLARDVFLMQTLIASRQENGKTCFLCGKTSTDGDPLKPSRLLFRCDDNELAERAERLFSPVESRRPTPASSPVFLLNPCPPDTWSAERRDCRSMSATRFRDYLACPFRFYLKHILKMEPLDDTKRGMDALDFGLLVHEALQAMGNDPDMRTCTDAEALADFLRTCAQDTVNKLYGPHPALPIQVSLDAACRRLSAAAAVQAGLAAEGWKIERTEVTLELSINGMPVRGKIDRIDRHPDGRVRVIDYKTSDKADPPAATHLCGAREDDEEAFTVLYRDKPKRWSDLQLPLYGMLHKANGGQGSVIELAYFSLPRAVVETGLMIWNDFTPDLAKAAERCAKTIVQRVQQRTFWPPAERLRYDDFEALFPLHTPEEHLDEEAFRKYMEGGAS